MKDSESRENGDIGVNGEGDLKTVKIRILRRADSKEMENLVLVPHCSTVLARVRSQVSPGSQSGISHSIEKNECECTCNLWL